MPQAPSFLRVGVASLNQTVGDWTGNEARIRQALSAAKDAGVVLLGLPEMCVSGYSLGDRVWMKGTLERSWQMVERIRPATQGLIVSLGLPISHKGALYDAVVVLADGEIIAVVPKENLATGDVEYENRWYSGWSRGQVAQWVSPSGQTLPMGNFVFTAEGVGSFAIEVCEDGWKGVRPGSQAALAGAHIVINASASWFTLGKHSVRRNLVREISRQDRVAYLYTSLHGCDATRLVFDGSTFIASDGELLEEGDRFQFNRDVVLIHHSINMDLLQRGRLTEGSWRQQVDALDEGEYGLAPQSLTIKGQFPTSTPPNAPAPYWEVPQAAAFDPSLQWALPLIKNGDLGHADLPHLELELALCMGLHEYLRKTGIPGVALALSGGRDSSMCAALLHRMLVYRHPDLSDDARRQKMHELLITAYLATDHSGSATRTAAGSLAEEIGAKHLTSEIQDAVDLHRTLVGKMVGEDIGWTDARYDIPLQNVQARLRGSLIWMVANLSGRLLLTTSNKSEVAVGYTTMDGDTSGGLAPIADVPKSLVTAWLHWAAFRHQLKSLDLVLGTPATAELRPAEHHQTDEDDLMPFEVLDRLMYHFAYLGEEPLTMFTRLWDSLKDRYDGNANAFADHITKFIKLFCRAQWKRERFAISFRVTSFDLDPKTGFRFPAVQDPFTEELRELRDYVGRL